MKKEYEELLYFEERSLHPDFTIKNPYTGKSIIWEHFGILGDPIYVDKMEDNVAFYYKNGYVSSEDIIFTFEFDSKSQAQLQSIVNKIKLY